jgi:hypothetical protein
MLQPRGPVEKFKVAENLNFFDLIAIVTRFFKAKDALEKLEELVTRGVLTGDLRVLPLIGFDSKMVFPLL